MDDTDGPATPAPHGPEEVRAALLEAAGRLFAERGPAAVSVRQIAAAAGVNHGLVHHYFGSKEALLHQVVRSRALQVMADMATAWDTGEADRDGAWAERLWRSVTSDDRWKIVVRALLDGYGGELLEPGTPGLHRMVDRVRSAQELGLLADDVDPAVVVAFGTSLLWGSLVMEPLLGGTPAGGLDPEVRVAQMGRMWRRAIGLAVPPSPGPADDPSPP